MSELSETLKKLRKKKKSCLEKGVIKRTRKKILK